MSARIVVVSGAPGTGKTSVSRILAENSEFDRAVHFHTDDFYMYIRKGYVEPWEDGSGDQNETVIETAAVTARRFCEGGYEVYVDGVVGPWFLAPWIKLAQSGIDVRYIVLRPDEQTNVSRAMGRPQKDNLTQEIIRQMWQAFADLGEYEAHVLDTTGQAADESVALIRRMLGEGRFRLV